MIDKFKLAPAGSKGCWGLDDYFHILFIIGASQLAKKETILMPSCILQPTVVAEQKNKYIFMNLIDVSYYKFIYLFILHFSF